MCRSLNRVITSVYQEKASPAEAGPEWKQFNLWDVTQYSVLSGLIFSVYINNFDLRNALNFDETWNGRRQSIRKGENKTYK